MPAVRNVLVLAVLVLLGWAPGFVSAQGLPPSVDHLVANAKKQIKTISLSELKSALDRADAGILVDVREPGEFAVGAPHKCPMAPLEIAFMLHDYFKDRGIRDTVQLHYTYPIGRVHSLENVAKWAAPEFDRLGITYETLFKRRSTARTRS